MDARKHGSKPDPPPTWRERRDIALFIIGGTIFAIIALAANIVL